MPWIDVPVWNGTTEEVLRLVDAIGHHCECLALKRRCPAHEAMLDQRWLDTILFLRFLRERLLEEEGLPCVKRSSSSV